MPLNEDHQKSDIIDVVVILAVRNEELYIAKCLESLLNQDYPRDKYGIIVIDGMSEDNTKQIAEKYQKRFPNRIKIYDNPKRIQAAGRNVGIKNSSSEFVVYVDGHSQPSTSYIRRLISLLRTSPDIAGVGGIHDSPPDETFFGKATNLAQRSFLGGAGSSYRQRKAHLTDSVAFCMYRRKILEKTGLYDEGLIVGEDYELNWRVRRSGFKLMVTPDAVIYYYRKHNTFRTLSERMLKYGLWKARVIKIHPQSMKIITVLPILLIILCVLYLPLSLFRPGLAYLDLFIITVYLVAVFATSIFVCAKEKDIRYMIIFGIIIIEHFAMGIGLLAGFIKGTNEKNK